MITRKFSLIILFISIRFFSQERRKNKNEN
uniref:Uncharacterized protein n=1 Tax=Podoviridae sp. ctDd04 TaxID=2825232 RepID=A0A8S5U7F8_9CAUD|nr:MAG TPA: hypothetical protein [Podoviridae sp. ctDd04]